MTPRNKPPEQSPIRHASACLISDLHLDETRPDVTDGLARFLERLGPVEALYILGDLFEAWIGDDDDRPLAGTVAKLLASVSRRGIALYLMPGNRDFLLGQLFCQRAGGTLLADPALHILGDRATLLMHGDSLCTGDPEYQSFRRMTREPKWQSEVLARPLYERRELAARLRAMSQDANRLKAEDIMDVDPGTVAQSMRDWQVERLIHGHTHRPGSHRVLAGTRWVLGDWGQDGGWRIDVTRRGPALTPFNYRD